MSISVTAQFFQCSIKQILKYNIYLFHFSLYPQAKSLTFPALTALCPSLTLRTLRSTSNGPIGVITLFG